MLLHLLLGDFVNFVLELYGQQGVAMAVTCVKVKKGLTFVYVQMMNCQCVKNIVETVPSRLLWDDL